MNINFQGLLQSTCSVLGFEVGEIWLARKQPGTDKVLLRFHQLHISSIYEEDRKALIQPNGFEAYSDESDHKASPYMCKRAFENGKIVWANAKVCEGLVARDVPLHTAVGIPICTVGEDLCVIILFAVGVVQMTPRAIQFLCATKAALPYYDKLSNYFYAPSAVILQEFLPVAESQDVSTATTIPSVPSWINLAYQDMNELVTCSDGSVNGLHSSWSYLRLSNLWNPTNENGTVLVDGKLSYTELKERFHELMIGLLHLTNFEITELWLVEESQDTNPNESPTNGRLSVVAAFHTDTTLQPWAAFTRLITLTIGLDFPGQVVQSGRPITDTNYGQHHIYDPLYPRALHAKELGLKAAFGVPLPRGSGVCGTLVFYSRYDAKIHPKLVTMITASAYLLAGSWPLLTQASFQNTEMDQKLSSASLELVPSGENLQNGNDVDIETSRSYEIESKTLIDFAFSNALEFLSDNLDTWPDQGIVNILNDNLDQTPLVDPLSTFPDAGRKRSRTTRSPRGSFGQLSDVFEDEKCRRCNRPKDKYGQYCHNCEHSLLLQMNTISPPLQTMPNQQLIQQIPHSTGVESNSNFQIPRTASSLFGMPPSATAFMPQYCMPSNVFAEYQQYHPHRRPSAEIALAMSNEGFYMGESHLSGQHVVQYPQYMKLYSDQAPPELHGLDPNLDIFHQNANYVTPDVQSQSSPGNGNPNLGVGSLSATNPTAKLCKYRGCKNTTVQRSPYCASHAGSRKCQQEGCTKCAQGSTKLCIAHGGGRRCTYPGCTKGARDKFFCAGHGGGKRCEIDGCTKSAVGSSKFCTNHGGGKRCKEPGCQKSAQSSTPYCVRHGGGRKCVVPGCTKVSRGKTNYCASHGGGSSNMKCRATGCNATAHANLRVCQAHLNDPANITVIGSEGDADEGEEGEDIDWYENNEIS